MQHAWHAMPAWQSCLSLHAEAGHAKDPNSKWHLRESSTQILGAEETGGKSEKNNFTHGVGSFSFI
jgi:hypothetical protein